MKISAARAKPTPQRKPQRLPHFDYGSAGAYFVTVCLKDKKSVLGKMVEEKINLSKLGEAVSESWYKLPQHYSSIDLDEFVVMPNHVHGIIWILSESSKLESVGAGLKPAPTRHALPEIIWGFKTFSARKVNELRNTPGDPLWQRGYYEHILRNDDDLYQHRSYIVNIPLKWGVDEYYQ